MRDQKLWIKVAVAAVAVVGVCATVVALIKTRKAKVSTAFEASLDLDPKNEAEAPSLEEAPSETCPQPDACDCSPACDCAEVNPYV